MVIFTHKSKKFYATSKLGQIPKIETIGEENNRSFKLLENNYNNDNIWSIGIKPLFYNIKTKFDQSLIHNIIIKSMK